MNSLERVCAAVRFKQHDRVPVIAQVFGHAAVFSGVHLGDYLRDGELLAKCQLRALEYYGYDAVFALMDVNVETEAAGSSIAYSEDAYPHVASFAVASTSQLEGLSTPNPKEAGRMPEILKSVSILRKEVGDEVLVVGCALGPASLANQLHGPAPALYLAVDDPVSYCKLLDYATSISIAFGVAQIQAGAHIPIIFDPAASPSVVPPRFYQEFILPRHKRLFSALEEAGAVCNWLHIAGKAASILEFYPDAGVDIANLDFCISPDDAKSRLPKTCVDGNIKPLLFVDGKPEEVAAESAKLMGAFEERGGFILSSGCEIPPEAKPENIKAMVDAVRCG